MGRLKKRKRLSQQFAATARSKLRMLRYSAEQTLVLDNSSQINEVEEILLQSDEAGTIPLLEVSLQSNEAQQIPFQESSIEADVLPCNDIEVAGTVVTDSVEDFSSIDKE